MKLYKSNSGRWFGRQDDARKAVGNHKFGEVEVPTDKWGLIDWLNAKGIAALRAFHVKRGDDVRLYGGYLP